MPNQAESFLHLIDAYAGKRSDQAVRDMVSKIYHISLSSPMRSWNGWKDLLHRIR